MSAPHLHTGLPRARRARAGRRARGPTRATGAALRGAAVLVVALLLLAPWAAVSATSDFIGPAGDRIVVANVGTGTFSTTFQVPPGEDRVAVATVYQFGGPAAGVDCDDFVDSVRIGGNGMQCQGVGLNRRVTQDLRNILVAVSVWTYPLGSAQTVATRSVDVQWPSNALPAQALVGLGVYDGVHQTSPVGAVFSDGAFDSSIPLPLRTQYNGSRIVSAVAASAELADDIRAAPGGPTRRDFDETTSGGVSDIMGAFGDQDALYAGVTHGVDWETTIANVLAVTDWGGVSIELRSIPFVEFRLADSGSMEDISPVSIEVWLSHDWSEAVNVTWQVDAAEGTVQHTGPDKDYTAASGYLVFPPGVTRSDIVFPITDDRLTEIDEDLHIDLGVQENARIDTRVMPNRTHVFWIEDDDHDLWFETSDGNRAENSGDPEIRMVLSKPWRRSAAPMVHFNVTNHEAEGPADTYPDHNLTSGSFPLPVEPPGGTTEYAFDFPVPLDVWRDEVFEIHEDLTIFLWKATGANAEDLHFRRTTGPAQGHTSHNHTITNDEDVPAAYFANATVTVAEEGNPVVAIDVNLTRLSEPAVEVDVVDTTTPEPTEGAPGTFGADYNYTMTRVVFPERTWTNRDATVRVFEDPCREVDETVWFGLEDAFIPEAARAATLGTPDSMGLTVTSADLVARVRFDSSTSSRPDGTAVPETLHRVRNVTLALDHAECEALEITLQHVGGTASAVAGAAWDPQDFEMDSSTVAFAPGTERAVLGGFWIRDDDVDEAVEDILLRIVAADGADIDAAHDETRLQILEDDVAAIRAYVQPQVVEGDAGTRTVEVFVNLTAPSDAGTPVIADRPVRVNVTLGTGTASNVSTGSADPLDVSFEAGFPGYVEIQPGATSAQLRLLVHGDDVVELDESARIRFDTPPPVEQGDPDVAAVLVTPDVAVTIIDDDTATVSLLGDEVVEGDVGAPGQPLRFCVVLHRPGGDPASPADHVLADRDVTARLTTGPGALHPATADVDHVAVPGHQENQARAVVVTAGASERCTDVTVHGDNIHEHDETLNATIAVDRPLPQDGGYPAGKIVDGTLTAVGTILNNEPGPALRVVALPVTEGDTGDSPATITVEFRLDRSSETEVTFRVDADGGTATEGTDHTFAQDLPWTVAFARDDGTGPVGATLQTRTITSVPDDLNEGDETIGLRLTALGGGTLNQTQPAHVDATILDDDPVHVTLTAAGQTVSACEDGSERPPACTTRLDFTLVLADATEDPLDPARRVTSQHDIQVCIATKDGTARRTYDFDDPSPSPVVSGDCVTVPAGATEASFTIDPHEDGIDEDNETFLVALDPASLAWAGSGAAPAVDTRNVTARIRDADPAPTLALLAPAEVEEGDAGDTRLEWTFILQGPSERRVAIDYGIEDDTATMADPDPRFHDYTRDPATTAGDRCTGAGCTFTVGVTVHGDRLVEGRTDGRERMRLVITDHHNITPSQYIWPGTIIDDDSAIILFHDRTVPEAIGSAHVNVTLVHPDGEPALLDWGLAIPYWTETTLPPGAATPWQDHIPIDPDDAWTVTVPRRHASVTPVTATISVIDDDLWEEEAQSLRVATTEACICRGAAAAQPAAAMLTILDDEDPTVVAIDATTLVLDPEGDSGTRGLPVGLTFTPRSERAIGFTYETRWVVGDGSDHPGNATADDVVPVPPTPLLYGLEDQVGASLPDFDVLGDVLHEGDESFTVRLSGIDVVGAAFPDDATVLEQDATIVDDDPLRVWIEQIAPGRESDEQTDQVDPVAGTCDARGTPSPTRFALHVTHASIHEVAIGLTTESGTGLAGALRSDDNDPYDFQNETGTHVVPAFQASHVVDVPVFDDCTLEESPETFTVLVGQLPTEAALDPRSTAIGEILDDDGPPAFHAWPHEATEEPAQGEHQVDVVVNLTYATQWHARVDYTLSHGTTSADDADLTRAGPGGASGTLVFCAGTQVRKLPVFIQADHLDEAAEDFALALADPAWDDSPGTASLCGGATPGAPVGEEPGLGTPHRTYTVLDEPADRSRITIADVRGLENETTTVTVQVDPPSSRPITLAWSWEDPLDGWPLASGDLGCATPGCTLGELVPSTTIPALATRVDLDVPVQDDATPEDNETVLLRALAATRADDTDPQADGPIVPATPARIDIRNDDAPPTVTLVLLDPDGSPALPEEEVADDSATRACWSIGAVVAPPHGYQSLVPSFRVRLVDMGTGTPDADLEAWPAPLGPQHHNVEVPPGQTDPLPLPQVCAASDERQEHDEDFAVRASQGTPGHVAYTNGNRSDLWLTILDNDMPQIQLLALPATSNEGEPRMVEVRLVGDTDLDVLVHLATSSYVGPLRAATPDQPTAPTPDFRMQQVSLTLNGTPQGRTALWDLQAPIHDWIDEPEHMPEAYNVTASSPSAHPPADLVLSIQDLDRAQLLLIDGAAPVVADEDASIPFVFPVEPDMPVEGHVLQSVYCVANVTAESNDWTAAGHCEAATWGTFTYPGPAGHIMVGILPDEIVEGNERIELRLTQAAQACTAAGAACIEPGAGNTSTRGGTITETERLGITMETQPPRLEGRHGTSHERRTWFNLTHATEAPVQLRVGLNATGPDTPARRNAVAGDDFEAVADQDLPLAGTPGVTPLKGAITVTIRGDALHETDEWLDLAIEDLSRQLATPQHRAVSPRIIVIDDDVPGIATHALAPFPEDGTINGTAVDGVRIIAWNVTSQPWHAVDFALGVQDDQTLLCVGDEQDCPHQVDDLQPDPAWQKTVEVRFDPSSGDGCTVPDWGGLPAPGDPGPMGAAGMCQVRVLAVHDFRVDEPERHMSRVVMVASSEDPDYRLTRAWDLLVDDIDQPEVLVETCGPGQPCSPTQFAHEESGRPALYTLRLTTIPDENVLVRMHPGPEVTASPVSVTFTPDDWHVPKVVTVHAIDDDYDEGTGYHMEEVRHGVETTDVHYRHERPRLATIHIAEDDVSSIVLQDVIDPRVEEGGGWITYHAVLGTRPRAPVEVAVLPDNQLEAIPAKWTVSPEDWDRPTRIQVRARQDNTHEDAWHVGHVRHQATSLDGYYAGMAQGLDVLVRDDDAVPRISFSAAALHMTEAESRPVLDFVLSSARTTDTVIEHALETGTAHRGTDFLYDASPAVIPAGSRTVRVPVTILDDDLAEQDEGFAIVITGPAGSVGDPARVEVTIQSEDALAPLVAHSNGGTDVWEGGPGDEILVRLNSRPIADVQVRAAMQGSEASLPGTPTARFTPADWDQWQAIQVVARDDRVVDGPQTGWAEFTIDGGATQDVRYIGAPAQHALVTAHDNDVDDTGGRAPPGGADLDPDGTGGDTDPTPGSGSDGNSGGAGGDDAGTGTSGAGDDGSGAGEDDDDGSAGNDAGSGTVGDDAVDGTVGDDAGDGPSDGASDGTSGPGSPDGGAPDDPTGDGTAGQGGDPGGPDAGQAPSGTRDATTMLGVIAREGNLRLTWPPQGDAVGYQVWRLEDRTWVLHADVPTPVPQDVPPGTYKLTYYTGHSLGEGQADQDPAGIPGWDPTVTRGPPDGLGASSGGSGMPLPAVLAMIVLPLLGVPILLWLARRSRQERGTLDAFLKR